MDGSQLQQVDGLIEEAIEDELTPGAALLVLRNGVTAHRQFYGHFTYEDDSPEVDHQTVYDLASFTKPVATTAAVMHLLEQGKLSFTDAVSDHIDDFEPVSPDDNGDTMRIIHLLTHTSGFPPIITAEQVEEHYGEADRDNFLEYIRQVDLQADPGDEFIYSDIGFITLQFIIENITGYSLDTYTDTHIFEPLGMEHTGFNPGSGDHIAPTEEIDGEYLTGTVHDPRAREIMGGIAGHAGLFSNLDDLGRYAQFMLNKGMFDGERLLSSSSVKASTRLPHGMEEFGRAPGWDMHSPFSTNLGDLTSDAAYGHTGYTGGSIHIDPEENLAVIFLTNRVYPDDSSSVVRLRRYVANLISASIR